MLYSAIQVVWPTGCGQWDKGVCLVVLYKGVLFVCPCVLAARSGCRRGPSYNATSSIWADPGCQHPRRGILLVMITRHTQVIRFYITRRRGCIISIKPRLPLRKQCQLKNICSVNFWQREQQKTVTKLHILHISIWRVRSNVIEYVWWIRYRAGTQYLIRSFRSDPAGWDASCPAPFYGAKDWILNNILPAQRTAADDRRLGNRSFFIA